MKIARVVPIFKSGDPSDANNYRPISVLPTMSKVIEKIVHEQLYKYICLRSILFAKQYGFCSKMSTVQAIIDQTQYLYDTIDAGNVVFSLFLDFRKVFDTVNHEILLSKLNFYGIRGKALALVRFLFK